MYRFLRVIATVPAALMALALLALPTGAGPDKIAYPANWKDHVLYTTVDRYDVKQYRELYANTQAAVDAMKQGKDLPNGTILTLVQYKAQVDAAGAPVKGPNGRFVKGDLIAHAVMEKREGWGTEYPAEWRNGNWEYAVFGPDTKLNEKANYKGCFECHKPHEKQDYVISLAALKSVAAAPAHAGSKADVNIMGFAFGPAKASIETGKNVTWTNADDSPHQITIVSTKERSAILRKGESHTQTFKAACTYEYICGLHPQMKGAIEVK